MLKDRRLTSHGSWDVFTDGLQQLDVHAAMKCPSQLLDVCRTVFRPFFLQRWVLPASSGGQRVNNPSSEVRVMGLTVLPLPICDLGLPFPDVVVRYPLAGGCQLDLN